MLLPTEHRKACSMNCDQLEAASNSICWGHHSGFSKFCGSRHDSSCWCQRQPLSLPPSYNSLIHTNRCLCVWGSSQFLDAVDTCKRLPIFLKSAYLPEAVCPAENCLLNLIETCKWALPVMWKNCFCLLQKALWCPVGSTCVKRI